MQNEWCYLVLAKTVQQQLVLMLLIRLFQKNAQRQFVLIHRVIRLLQNPRNNNLHDMSSCQVIAFSILTMNI